MSGVNDHYRMVKHIEQTCSDCILRIEAWKPYQGEEGFVDVQIISNNTSRYHMLFGTRIKNAWKVLRGHYDWSGFEVFEQAEAEALVSALQIASREAFPNIISETVVKRP